MDSPLFSTEVSWQLANTFSILAKLFFFLDKYLTKSCFSSVFHGNGPHFLAVFRQCLSGGRLSWAQGP